MKNNKPLPDPDKLSFIESKHGFFEVFNDKKIKKSFHNMKSHNMKKKYISKIPFNIVETIAFDKGQLYFWVFTDSQGYVMRKSNKKLNKAYIIEYFLTMILEYFRIEQGIKISKSLSQILIDIYRFSSQDEKLDNKLIKSDPAYSYLNIFIELQNFHIVYANEFMTQKKTNLVNIFEFNKIINDATLLSNILLIQNYLYINRKYKPFVFKYMKKSDLATKKVALMAEGPIKKFEVTGNHEENFVDKFDERGMITINDNNMCMQIDNVLEPFVRLIERSYNIIIREANFKLLKFRKKISEEDNRHIDYIVYTFCNFVMAVDKSNEEYQKKENEMKIKMNQIREKNIPNDLKNLRDNIDDYNHNPKFYTEQKLYNNTLDRINKNGYNYMNSMNNKNTNLNGLKGKNFYNNYDNMIHNMTSSNYSKFYEFTKITKSSFCYGEFCEYIIPEVLKHLKKNQKLEMLSNKIPLENKISTRDKYNNLPNVLPAYLIKKAYDNPDMVDIVLKAYSIFPKDFDKERAMKRIEENRKRDEEKRKEREKREEEETKRMEEEKKRVQYTGAITLPSIHNSTISISSDRREKISHINSDPNLKFRQLNNNTEKNSDTLIKDESSSMLNNKNKSITLYIPDPDKFKQFNYDSMYSQKNVCNNCYVVYILIESFLSNIDETTSQFKSLRKAREILFLGDKLKIPFSEEDSFVNDQTENLLFQEEKSDFNLKYILKRNLNRWKKDAMDQKEKRKSNPKIVKKRIDKKNEFSKAFSYNLDVNPKLLKFNLIAEKTRNTFFNLIFNELNNKPESIYERLGIKNNSKIFTKSMTTLRMHMGINSLGYNINPRDMEKLYDKLEKNSDELDKSNSINSFLSEEKNEITYEIMNKNKNQPIDFFQIDIDLFSAYKQLKRKFWSSNFTYDKKILGGIDDVIDNMNFLNSNYNKNNYNNESFSKIQNDDAAKCLNFTKKNIENEAIDIVARNENDEIIEKCFNKCKTNTEITKIDKVAEDIDIDKTKIESPSKSSVRTNILKASTLRKINTLSMSNIPIKTQGRSKEKAGSLNLNQKISTIPEPVSNQDAEYTKSNLIKRQFTNYKNRITFNFDSTEVIEVPDLPYKSQKRTLVRSVTTQSNNSKKETERNVNIDQSSNNNNKMSPNTKNNGNIINTLSLNNSINTNNESNNISSNLIIQKSSVNKKTNPDLFVSNFGSSHKSSLKHINNNNNIDLCNDQVIQEEDNQLSIDYLTENKGNQTRESAALNDQSSPSLSQLNNSKEIDNITNKSSITAYESKKVTVSSMLYHDWKKETSLYEISQNHYYHITTPLTKFNEIYTVVNENPLLDMTAKITIEEYIKIGKFSHIGNLLNKNETNIFIYDQYTAVPYKVMELKSSENMNHNNNDNKCNMNNDISLRKEDELKKNLTSNNSKQNSNLNLKELYDGQIKQGKLLVIVLNDFYDSFTKYEATMKAIWSNQINSLQKLNLVFFNFPGQSGTFFSKKSILNNIFYSEFLDRLIFHLLEKGYFDHTYQLILVGFGNGGHVALTYASFYEKYWDFLHSIILFNTYCENDDFLNKSMLEIMKIIDSTKNRKLVNFFVKSVTVNPQKLVDIENSINFNETSDFSVKEKINSNSFNKPSRIEDDSLGITSTGIYNITKGYFYNMKINFKEIMTSIVLIHSNQNCFITLNNITGICSNMKNKQEEIMMADNNIKLNKKNFEKNFLRTYENIDHNGQINQSSCLNENYLDAKTFKHSHIDFSENLPSNKIRRKFIIVDGSHDLILENSQLVVDIINSYLTFVRKYMPSPLFGDK